MKGLIHRDYRDVFRGVRYGLSLKKAFFIYVLLVIPALVLSLIAVKIPHGEWLYLLLIFPYALLKLAISKMVFEQLKGDDFYPMGKALKFVLRNVKHYIAFLVVDIVLAGFFYLLFVLLAFLGKVHFLVGVLLLPVGLFVFAFMVYLLVGLVMSEGVGIPAIATQEYDAFDTLYESLSMFNSQVYRFVFYKLINLLQSVLVGAVIGLLLHFGFVAWSRIAGWSVVDNPVYALVMAFALSFAISVWFATDLIAYLVMVYKRDGVDLSKGLPESLENIPVPVPGKES